MEKKCLNTVAHSRTSSPPSWPLACAEAKRKPA
ncbi:hypothetical protein V461_22375 [Pantoea ananatis BRT98]|nr:hypothetical protein V461_22375 [Pantoea ananatis BRT98]